MTSIPEYTLLGAYAEEHPDELCRFVTELFDAEELVEIIDCEPFFDFVEVGLVIRWHDGEESVLCKDSVELYGSTRDFRMAATFSFNVEDVKKWANWCIRHCGHWALREEETR